MDHLCFVILLRLFIAALWSPTGKGLTSWLSFVMFNCVFVTFPCGIFGMVWNLIVSIPDFCQLSYFQAMATCPYGHSCQRDFKYKRSPHYVNNLKQLKLCVPQPFDYHK